MEDGITSRMLGTLRMRGVRRWRTTHKPDIQKLDLARGSGEQSGETQPIFMPKKDPFRKDGLVEQTVVPLQAADWLAYESFLAMKKENMDRWARQEFETTPGEVVVYLASGLKEMQEILAMDATLSGQMFKERA